MTATPIEDAQVVYEPDPDFAGEDGLDYKITNPIGQAAECHVRFEVVEPIVAVDDTAETEVDEPVTIDVLANDYPLDDYPYVVITREPEHGTVVEAMRTVLSPTRRTKASREPTRSSTTRATTSARVPTAAAPRA